MLCPKCYHDIPPGLTRCPRCEGEAASPEGEVRSEEPTPSAAPAGEEEGCPWERRGEIGLVNGLGETLQQSLFHPTEFFGRLPPENRVGSAILYAVVIGTIAAAVSMMWQRVMSSPAVWSEISWEIPPLAGYFWYGGLAALPLLIVLAVFVRSAFLHLSLLVLGGGGEGYGATLKVTAYAASASAFNVFPFCGAPIALVWRAVLIVIGLKEVHRISTARAFLVWLLPFLVLSCVMAAALGAMVLVMIKMFPAVMGELIEV